MKRIRDFFDRAISEINEFWGDRPDSRFATKSVNTAVRLSSSSTDSVGPPRDTVQILDISGSMGNSDYTPTRLDGGIQAATEYVKGRSKRNPKDRIAAITFNTKARIVLPLTPVDEKERIVTILKRLKAGGGTDIAEGLQAAIRIFSEEPVSDRLRQIILLSDGDGGNPISKASVLKNRYGVVISVVGIGGTHKVVKESLLRKVATTDNHYRFIKDSATLKQHYHQLATGLVWGGNKR